MSQCPLPPSGGGLSRAARPPRPAPFRCALPAAAAQQCHLVLPEPARAAPCPQPRAGNAPGRPGLGAAGRLQLGGPAAPTAPQPLAGELCPERRIAAGRGRSFLLTGDNEQQRSVEHQVTKSAEQPSTFHRIYVGCGRGPGSGRSRARLNPSHTAGRGRAPSQKAKASRLASVCGEANIKSTAGCSNSLAGGSDVPGNAAINRVPLLLSAAGGIHLPCAAWGLPQPGSEEATPGASPSPIPRSAPRPELAARSSEAAAAGTSLPSPPAPRQRPPCARRGLCPCAAEAAAAPARARLSPPAG